MKPLVRIRQEFGPGQLRPVRDVGHVEVMLPSREKILPKKKIFSIIVDEGLAVRISAKKLKTFALNKCFITQTFAR